jgi:hypothetical protein
MDEAEETATIVETKVGARTIEEIQEILQVQGYNLAFSADGNALYVEITWYHTRCSVLVLCHGQEEYWRGYDDLQRLQDNQPWDLSRFTVVQREDEEPE